MKQGLPGALLELRVRNEHGDVPATASRWASSSFGALRRLGLLPSGGRPATGSPRTAGSAPATSPRSTRAATSRSVTAPRIWIKSGGEWISSVALEGALMGHPAVAEAAVVAVPHPAGPSGRSRRWCCGRGARPRRRSCSPRSSGRFPRWWLPDDVVFLPAIPRTSTGKFLKSRAPRRASRPLRRCVRGAPAGEPAPRPLGPAGHRPPRRVGARAGEHAARVRAGASSRAPTRSSWTCGSRGTARRSCCHDADARAHHESHRAGARPDAGRAARGGRGPLVHAGPRPHPALPRHGRPDPDARRGAVEPSRRCR